MLVGSTTDELRMIGAQIMYEQLHVKPRATDQYLFWVNEETKNIEWCVCYTGFIGKSCHTHVINLAGKRPPRPMLKAAFETPFNQWGFETVFGVVNSLNVECMRFTHSLGYKEFSRAEGLHDDGGDIVTMRMNKADCRWIKEKK